MSAEIISVAQMRAIDAACPAAGVATRALMEAAGNGLAGAVMQRYPRCNTAIVCGPGNNGGDGWVAARLLQEQGWPVWVETLVPRETLRGDAAEAARAWTGRVYDVAANAAPEAELYIDAMFGAGLSRPLEGDPARMANMFAERGVRVLSVDVPSGLDADLAKPLGEVCVRANCTVTFVRLKPAHVLLPGRELCGDTICLPIGAPDRVVDALGVTLWENNPELWRASLPRPALGAHKYQRGHVIVASGGRARTGAARLAAQAALRIGAGLVTVLSPPDAMAENAAQLTSIMLREANHETDYCEAARAAQACVIGPAFGVSDAHRGLLERALAADGRCPFVLDADAITLLAPLNRALHARDVLTPHVGEFKRAFPGVLDRAGTRIDAARVAAVAAGCVVLLKGPDTVIAAPDGRAIVNTTGSPFLATAGSGDVLAGLIAGLMGQGMPSFDAAAAGAWLHGISGFHLGAGLIAEDLPKQLGNEYRALLGQVG